ncbi:MAG: hypothetical protein KatS3mg105_3661 [Gemmatales bacterium]|nr:MAG: hypothetical protein KatS3mg105_3661 [Gemmatales bacterium]
MKSSRLVWSLASVLLLAGLAYVAQKTLSSGVDMTTAAERFLASLDDAQKKKASFGFDDPERTNWHFIPMQDKMRRPTRKGLGLFEMNPKQREAALALVRAGTSMSGYKQATTIMSLEAILRELEKNGRSVRDPEWYFFSVFGTPSKTGKWGWRVEGHHLSLNFVIDNGKVKASTPAFFGANPAIVKTGPKKGQRTLEREEVLAKKLFRSLDEKQRALAYRKKNFPEIEQGKPKPNVGKPEGVPASLMNDEQKATLLELLETYTNRMPADVAAQEMAELKKAGVDRIHFAYAGGIDDGKPYTYRIQGPTFIVEFLNTQPDSLGNPANHIHSVWRKPAGDFGL